MGKKAFRIVSPTLFLLFSLSVIPVPSLYAENIDITNRETYGLAGAVKTLEESWVTFDTINGEWSAGEPFTDHLLSFNEDGSLSRLDNNFLYDGTFMRTSYTYIAKGDRLLLAGFRNYDRDGRVTNRETCEYNDAGELITHRNNNGYRWTRTPEPDGGYTVREIWYGNVNTTARFDQSGRVVEKTSRYSERLRQWRFFYDSRGMMIRGEFRGSSEEEPVVWTLSYNGDGQLSVVKRSGPAGDVSLHRSFTYTGGGPGNPLPVKEISRRLGPDGKPIDSVEILYDDRGRKVKETFLHFQPSFSGLKSYRYGEPGEAGGTYNFNTEGDLLSVSKSILDTRGNRVVEQSSGPGVEAGSKILYEYDSGDRMIAAVRYTLEGICLSREYRQYDDRGQLVRSAMHYGDNTLNCETEYQYTYDESGNWIEQTVFTSSNREEYYHRPDRIIRRDIDYYSDSSVISP